MCLDGQKPSFRQAEIVTKFAVRQKGMVIKMKIVICDSDKLYLKRISSAFEEFYADKADVSVYSDGEKMQADLKDKVVDILIISENMADKVMQDSLEFEANLIMYFSDDTQTTAICDSKAICKFQQIDTLFEAVTGEYSQVNKFLPVSDENKEPAKIFTFVCAAGGSGASTAAAGFARHLAQMEKKTLFVSLEKLNSTAFFMKDEVNSGLTEAIEAVKDSKRNVSMKLSKCISTDNSGVNFIAPCKCVLDIQNAAAEDLSALMNAISKMNFDFIVVDTDMTFDEKATALFEKSAKVFLITDATPMSNKKTTDAVEVIRLIDSQKNTNNAEKLAVIYNKYSDTTSVTIENMKITINGAIPYFATCKTPSDVSQKISGMAMWNNVVKTSVQ